MAIPDPYGTDLLLTYDGDLSVTPAGQLALVTGPINCAQALVMRLRTSPGELPLQPGYGNALAPHIVGAKATDPSLAVSAVNTELRKTFEQDRRFLKAQNIAATPDPADPTRVGIAVEIVLAGGDRLETLDITGEPTIGAFQVAPELADTLTPDELAELAGANPDDDLDTLPELDEDLEGSNTFIDAGTL